MWKWRLNIQNIELSVMESMRCFPNIPAPHSQSICSELKIQFCLYMVKNPENEVFWYLFSTGDQGPHYRKNLIVLFGGWTAGDLYYCSHFLVLVSILTHKPVVAPLFFWCGPLPPHSQPWVPQWICWIHCQPSVVIRLCSGLGTCKVPSRQFVNLAIHLPLMHKGIIIMAALCNRTGNYILALWFLRPHCRVSAIKCTFCSFWHRI